LLACNALRCKCQNNTSKLLSQFAETNSAAIHMLVIFLKELPYSEVPATYMGTKQVQNQQTANTLLLKILLHKESV
jgi:hypothetical protein